MMQLHRRGLVTIFYQRYNPPTQLPILCNAMQLNLHKYRELSGIAC